MHRRITLSLLVLICAILSQIRGLLRQRYQPVAVIAPHHNIVADTRRQFFESIAKKRPVTNTVILLSPDHFSPIQNQIIYSDRNWQLLDGQLDYDTRLGSLISSSASLNPAAVKADHGIFNLLGDIHTVFPRARIVPFLIGQNVPNSDLDPLSDSLITHCRSDCLLVASVDFSHYLPAALADIHDLYSQKILSRLDFDSSSLMEVDSPQSLYLVMRQAIFQKAKSFRLYSHTNSGHLTNSPDAESTSHIFASYSRQISLASQRKYSTFTLARSLDPDSNHKTVGDRFFYGVDYIDSQLSQSFSPLPSLNISPGDNSSISFKDDILNIIIGSDFTVSGVVSDKLSYLVFSPLDSSSSSFLRGSAKTEQLEQLFSSLSNQPNLKLGFKSGIIYLP